MTASPGSTVRMTMCEACVKPVEAPPEATAATCTSCGATNELEPLDRMYLGATHGPGPATEEERLVRLRKQDGKPLMSPPELEDLLEHGNLADWKVGEAMEIWQGTRNEMRTAPNAAAEKRLMFLNLLLANKFYDTDPKLVQALREAALEVVTLRRNKQEIRCDLARMAANDGHFAEAEAWMEPCDPRSDDLAMDSAYRFSRALIDTQRDKYKSVIRTLGENIDDVPIADQYDVITEVLRANAYEKTGDLDRAVAQLQQAMAAGHARAISGLIQLYGPKFHWCEQSFPIANQAHSAAAGKRIGAATSGGAGGILYFTGLVQVLGGVAALIAAFSASMELLPAGIILILVGLGIMMWGKKQRAAAARAAHVRVNGLEAGGTVVSAQRTGLTVNGVPQMAITLRVDVEGAEPYQATTKLLVGPGAMSIMEPGKQLRIRVDPNDPSFIVLETN